jgi:hypothetical protein
MNEFFGQPVGILTKARADALYAALVHTHVKANITDLETITATPTNGAIPKADGSHILAAGWMPAFSGDASSSAGATALTLATVNSNVGSFGLAGITVNAKGLITAAAAASTTGSGSVVLSSSPAIVTPTIASFVNATHTHADAAGGGTIAHSVLTGLISGDPHTQYGLLAGRSGGQVLMGGTAASDGLTLTSTSNGTKGLITLDATLTVDGVNKRLGVNITAPLQSLHIFDGHVRMDRVPEATAPSVAVGAAGVLTGAYNYVVTFVNANGETSAGTTSATTNPSSQQVNLTNIPVSVDSTVTARKIYRTTAGGSTTAMKLVTTIADNSTTTYSDNIADGSLTTNMPWKNTTGGNVSIGAIRVMYADPTFTGLGLNVGNGTSIGGNQSVAVGTNALASVTNGNNNAALGYFAANALTTGTDTMAIGSNSLLANTTGASNTAVGSSSGRNNQTGGNNTWVGSFAGTGVAANSNSNNTGIGLAAGFALTTGGNNVLLGYRAGQNITTGSSNLIVGYNINAQSISASNQMSIGNLIFSQGIDGTTTTLSSGNIGIGIAAPGTKLHVVKEDSGTNTVVNVATIEHQSTGTPAASFGTGLVIAGEDSTTISVQMARLRSLWTTATHASYATRSVLSASDNAAERDVIGWGANGSAAILGFYDIAAAPIAKPTVTGSRGGNAALASLLTQGAALGLWTDSTSA